MYVPTGVLEGTLTVIFTGFDCWNALDTEDGKIMFELEIVFAPDFKDVAPSVNIRLVFPVFDRVNDPLADAP